jgi:hypothetical protein
LCFLQKYWKSFIILPNIFFGGHGRNLVAVYMAFALIPVNRVNKAKMILLALKGTILLGLILVIIIALKGVLVMEALAALGDLTGQCGAFSGKGDGSDDLSVIKFSIDDNTRVGPNRLARSRSNSFQGKKGGGAAPL